MSGHSKWSTIKNKKEKADNKRAKIFTKIGKEILVAVKIAGNDPSINSKLKDVIIKAKANNVPMGNIERLIKKASKNENDKSFFNVSYEGYGPGGVAVLVNVITDNKNRTVANLRHYFDKFGGNLAASGCVSYLFEKRGVIVLKVEKNRQDSLMEFCVEHSVIDCDIKENLAKVIVESEKFSFFVEKLKEKNYEFITADIEEISSSYVKIEDENNKEKMNKLIECLESDEDVNEFFTNYEELNI